MSESLFPIVKKQRQKTGSSIEDEAWGSPDTGLKDCNRYTSCLCLPPNVDRSGHRSGQWQHTRTLSVPTQPAINPHTRCCILQSRGVNAASPGKWLFLQPRLSPPHQTIYQHHQVFLLQDTDMLELVTTNKRQRHYIP